MKRYSLNTLYASIKHFAAERDKWTQAGRNKHPDAVKMFNMLNRCVIDSVTDYIASGGRRPVWEYVKDYISE